MKIAILGAMQEEVEPILERIGSYEKIEYANNNYYLASYKNIDLVIAYSKIGKVNAALSATLMIEKFGAQKLIFSGVAGAINPELKIGDLIYATKLYQHDVDITAFGHPFGFIPESKHFYESDSALNGLAIKVAETMGIALKGGVIATGDQFIADEKKKEWIQKTYDADALEMEGASVACVCDALGVPFFILRAISDAADMDAGFSFDEFLKSSAKNSADFTFKMLDGLR